MGHTYEIMGLICPRGTFCPWDILSFGTFCPLGRFVLWDVLSLGRFVPGTFCPLGRFVPGTFCPWDLMSWDVLSWDVLYVHPIRLASGYLNAYSQEQ